jgi:transcriptional regulator with XRE-family HTH domain
LGTQRSKKKTDSSFKAQVGQLIRFHRKGRGLTQQAVADQAGRSVEMINKIENGRAEPSFETLLLLSDVLDTPVRDFFGLGPHEAGWEPDPLADTIRRLADADDDRRADALRVLGALLAMSGPRQPQD